MDIKIIKVVNGNFLIICLILIGLILRLLLLPIPGFKFDVDTWFSWADRLSSFNFQLFYSDKTWTNYTPGYLYILSILGFLKNLFLINNSLFYILLKIPAVISEIILGFIIYFILKKQSQFWAKISAAFVLLNPAFIFNSSIWGQIEGLFSLLLFLSIFYLNEKKFTKSSLALAISFLVKPQAIIISPVAFLFFIKQKAFRKSFLFFTVSFISICILSFPFFLSNPFNIFNLFLKMTSDYQYNSLFAYNFWGIFGFWVNDSTKWQAVSLNLWGIILFGIYFILLGYLYIKKNLNFFALTTLLFLGFFFLPTRVHERYIYPSLVFLIFYLGFIKSKTIAIICLSLTLIHFLNLYYVYVYFNENYLKLPYLLYNNYLYSFLDNHGKLLSFLSFAIFIILNIVIIKPIYVFQKRKS